MNTLFVKSNIRCTYKTKITDAIKNILLLMSQKNVVCHM